LQQFLLLVASSESKTQSWPFLSHRFDPCRDAVDPFPFAADSALCLVLLYSRTPAAVVKKKPRSTQSLADMLHPKSRRTEALQLLSGESKFLRL